MITTAVSVALYPTRLWFDVESRLITTYPIAHILNFGDMTNIEIAKQVLGEDCEEYCTLVEEPPYKGYDVVACNPNEEFLGNPMYVLIKDGKGHRAEGQELDDLLFRPIDD